MVLTNAITLLASPLGFIVTLGVLITGAIYIFSSINKQTLTDYMNAVSAKNEIIDDLTRKINDSLDKLKTMQRTIDEQTITIETLRKQISEMTGYTQLDKILSESMTKIETHLTEIKQALPLPQNKQ